MRSRRYPGRSYFIFNHVSPLEGHQAITRAQGGDLSLNGQEASKNISTSAAKAVNVEIDVKQSVSGHTC